MATPSLLRVQVTAQRRRLDVSLPAEVALWEFLPEVLRGLGWRHDHARTVLVTAAGRRLDPERGLHGQDVVDGDVLTVAHAQEHQPAVLRDDLIEAVHERARVVLPSWSDGAAARARVVAPLVLAGLVVAVLSTAPLPPLLVAVASSGTLGVLAVAAYVGRDGPTWGAVTTAWLAVACASSVGRSGALVLGLGAGDVGVVAALAAGAVGLVALLVHGAYWPLHLPPLVAVAVWTAAGALTVPVGVPRWEVLLVVLAGATLVSTAVPALTVGATVARNRGEPESTIDVERLDVDILTAHRLVLALHLAGSLLLLALVPYAVGGGALPVGALLVLGAVRLLRLRHQRTAAMVAAGLASALLTSAWLVLHVVLARPDWVPWVLAVALGAAVAVCLATALTGGARERAGAGAWWGWCGDAAEMVLVVVLPLTVTAALWWDRWFTW
ncbi:EsaB/YukD family protein [Nocardioides daphniae]|uniref:Type VII secretion integral membrane protein EccD n=1 Tax=Nocardioides daphniae TaxID=402297 RepID=A0A4P7UGP0_9ACTN|nr:EsaB/YukD family protein [Nocardioides daphniae]QCC78398.1 hypothetical protein E2C04_16525 [Nocardioides daphniae]GGD12793.1 hypothetical protein GCM10007231_09760 [Nocardioides daphniae]